MKANETKFQDLVASNYQYVVPLFQRPYSWTKREWQQLWEDIKDLVESGNEHFIGSIVNIPTPSVPAGVSKFLLIDGQQRMTTLFIVMMVLRDRARTEDNKALADEINDMIVNRHKKGDDHYKLMPTQADREAYKLLIAGQAIPQSSSDDTGVQACYRFFRTQIAREELQPIFGVISGQLSIVSIVLDPNDNPHVVFESLNAKGRSLSQADLIRNYFFMRIDVSEHEEINTKYWQPMQNALGENTTEFIRHYLMRMGPNVRQPDVYQVIKQRIQSEKIEILAFLQQMARFGVYYQRILFPEQYESDPELLRRMQRLNTLQVTVAYPFLLNVYNDVEVNKLTQQELYAVLDTLENYIFRRAICSIPTYELNKLFPFLYGWTTNHKDLAFVIGLQTELQKRRYPRDEEFKYSLIHQSLYGAGERVVRTRFLLQTLERSYGHKETVDLTECTIEHIMPQTIDSWWQNHLGKDYEEVKETWLHTLGNLTLTAYNSEISNRSFPAKQHIYEDSNLQLNKTLQDYSGWNEQNIEHRAQQLAEQALGLWPDFRPSNSLVQETEGDVSGRKPYQVSILDTSYQVKSWADVLRQTMKVILTLAPEKMEALRDEFPNWLSNTAFRRGEPLSNGMYLNLNWKSINIYPACRKMVEFIEIGQDEWQVLVE